MNDMDGQSIWEMFEEKAVDTEQKVL